MFRETKNTNGLVCVYIENIAAFTNDIYIDDGIPIETRMKLATNADILFRILSKAIYEQRNAISNILICLYHGIAQIGSP